MKTLEEIIENRPIKLELGCGARKTPGYIGIDIRKYDDVDIDGDAFEILTQLPDKCCSEILAFHFFCHIDEWEKLLSEIARVLIPGGRIKIVNPHFSNPYAHNDPTHKKLSGVYSMNFFADCSFLRRKVPTYASLDLSVKSIRLEFKAERPFYFSYIVGRFWTAIMNLSYRFIEYYEWNLTGLIRCYEVCYVLEKNNS